MFKKIINYHKRYKLRQTYCDQERKKFFQLAAKYLPKDKHALILDIGAGDGVFAKTLDLQTKFSNFILLDANKNNIKQLKEEFGGKHVLEYKIPDPLPFNRKSVYFIHCSHVVEHLWPQDLYLFLQEVDRILVSKGILVISAPLLWFRFYDDLTHIKPYNPKVFLNYLIANSNAPRTNLTISRSYKALECIYRYKKVGVNDFDFYGHELFFIDAVVYALKLLLNLIGFKRYIKNGYTIIFQKE